MSYQPQKRHAFFVGIDSDGCAFDTMELKHKECFIPNIINSYDLQAVSKFAREAAEFVNLYSKSRGINRFPALIEALDWLRRRPDVRGRGFNVPDPVGLRNWLKVETKLSNGPLKAAAESSGDPDLVRALAWSEAVNATVEKFVRHVPPFPLVRECLARLQGQADAVVVSATPTDALRREWSEHGIEPFVAAICGQEVGTKKQILQMSSGYEAGKMLMIGDAPGDHQAAVANGALFFPINPGAEDGSWKLLYDEGIDRFLTGRFAGEFQDRILADFQARLPVNPPWPVV